MIAYLICCILPVISFLFFDKHKKKSFFYIFILLLPLFFLLAFKSDNIGADTKSYNRMFEMMKNGTFNQEASFDSIEPGYKYFLMLLTKISYDPHIQYVVCAVFFHLGLSYFIYKNTKISSLFVLFYMCFGLYIFYMSGLRQSIAITICLIAFSQAKQKHFFGFLLLVGLATLFHKSAVIFIFVYILSLYKFTKKIIPIYVGILIAVFVLGYPILFASSYFFDSKYGIEDARNGYVFIFIILMITIISFVLFKKLIKDEEDNAIIIQLNLVSACFWILRFFSRTAERPSLYFLPFTIILIERIFLLIKNDSARRITKFVLVSFSVLYFLYRLYIVGYIPYEAFFI